MGYNPNSEAALLFLMRTGLLALSQSCCNVDADDWCERVPIAIDAISLYLMFNFLLKITIGTGIF